MSATHPEALRCRNFTPEDQEMADELKAEELLTTTQVGKIVDKSVRTLEGWRQSGEGPGFLKIGRSVRYRRGVVEAWLQQCERSSTSDG